MTTLQTTQPSHNLTRQRVAELRVRCQQHPNDVDLQRQTVSEFLTAGLEGEAIPILRRLSALCPDDASVTTQLAAVLASTEHHGDALDLYRKLADSDPDSLDAQHNYGVAACHAGEYQQATIAFDRKLKLDPDNFETLNDLAVLYAMAGRMDDAAEMYTRSLAINPRYDRARDNAFQFFFDTARFRDGLALANQILGTVGRDREVESWKARFGQACNGGGTVSVPASVQQRTKERPTRVAGKKIGFVASSDAFLKPIIEYFGAHNQIRTFAGTSVRELADLLQWADLVWYEWCDQLVIEGSKLPRRAKTVCRLHSYEAFSDMPAHVNWSNIDHVILVSEAVDDILEDLSQVTAPRTVIHNGIDPDRFPAVPRTGLGKQLASVGYINYKKNPSLLLQTFKAIHDDDPEFEFHIIGTHQDPRIKLYMDNLLPRLDLPVTFHGWVEDMPGVYARMDYVISTSLFESFHYSIAEGMLSGCLPLIHSWKGADTLYPTAYLFDTPGQAVDVLHRYREMDIAAVREENRSFIIDRYAWSETFDKIDKLLLRVLNGAQPTERIAAHDWPAPAVAETPRDIGTVSCIIPVRNQAKDVGVTIDSLLNQTYQNVEIIVSDDGSTDDLDSVLTQYSGRIRTVRQVQRGCAAALNAGIQAAQGQFIALAMPGDSMAPERLARQLGTFTSTPDLGAVTCECVSQKRQQTQGVTTERLGPPQPQAVSPSSIVFRREELERTGWFEEYAPHADNPAALMHSFMRRVAELSTIRHLPDELVAESPLGKNGQMRRLLSVDSTVLDRWISRITVGTERVAEAAPDANSQAGLTIAFVGAHDPRGQLMMWAEALTQYTPHTVRVLTHAERNGCPSDLVLNRRGATTGNRQQRPSVMSTIEAAERIVGDADLVVFAAGIAPGSNRPDVQVADTDEQAYGTLEWGPLLKGKQCAALLFGTPSVRGNLPWYRDHFAAKGWPVLTADPDLYRWLPKSHFLPRLLSRAGDRYRRATPQFERVVVLHAGGRSPHEGSLMFREAAENVRAKHDNVTFGLCDGLPWAEMIAMKKQAHIGFDRIAVGSGQFGIDSLENSACGMVNIVYCDPFTRALLAGMLETDELPWKQPASRAELEAILTAYAGDTERLRHDITTTQQWFDQWWDERRLAPRVADVLVSLTETS